MDYEQYEKECEKIRKENEKLLSEFEGWLYRKNLSKRTVDKHLRNIDFYINEYLLYEEPLEAFFGAVKVGMFLVYWFIKKAMWASQSQIKENATSLKKFYLFMYEKGLIEWELYEDMVEEIKENMPEWLATMARYDDPTITDPEKIWFG